MSKKLKVNRIRVRRKAVLLIFINLLVSSFLIQSCNDEKMAPEKLTSFPMNVGTEWIYDYEDILIKYESTTSNKIINIDTVRSSFSVLISKDTLLRDSISVKEFITQEIGTQKFSKRYFKIDHEGLKVYAYKGSEPVIYSKSIINQFDDLSFDQRLKSSKLSDFIYFFDKPLFVLKLPLSQGDKWTYNNPPTQSDSYMNEEVVGYDKLNFSFGTFDCYKVKRIYKNISFFDEIEWIDWISTSGFMKQKTIYERENRTSEFGEVLGNYQRIIIITVNKLNIK